MELRGSSPTRAPGGPALCHLTNQLAGPSLPQELHHGKSSDNRGQQWKEDGWLPSRIWGLALSLVSHHGISQYRRGFRRAVRPRRPTKAMGLSFKAAVSNRSTRDRSSPGSLLTSLETRLPLSPALDSRAASPTLWGSPPLGLPRLLFLPARNLSGPCCLSGFVIQH